MEKLNRPVCPYCGKEAKYVNSSVVYGRSYGMIWHCAPCGAYVGCHKNTVEPLGTLANAAVRDARKKAHAAFDLLWQSGEMSRLQAYAWLRREMKMTAEECHIGKMGAADCARVVANVKFYAGDGEKQMELGDDGN